MAYQNKRSALFWIFLTALAFLLLSGSLSSIQLKPGQPFPLPYEGDTTAPSVDTLSTEPTMKTPTSSWVQGIAAFGFLLLLAFIGINLLTKIDRKKLLRFFFIIIFIFAVLSFLPLFAASRPSVFPNQTQSTVVPPTQIGSIPALEQPPSLVTWLLLVSYAAVFISFGLWLLRKAIAREDPRSEFALEAEKALAALRTGEEFNNVIIRCYMQMQKLLLDEQGIEREVFMTPGEFEAHLASEGVPSEPLHNLTRIFEEVRYGHKPTSVHNEQKAIKCLMDISKYLGKVSKV
jgi:hypothetical protein